MGISIVWLAIIPIMLAYLLPRVDKYNRALCAIIFILSEAIYVFALLMNR